MMCMLMMTSVAALLGFATAATYQFIPLYEQESAGPIYKTSVVRLARSPVPRRSHHRGDYSGGDITFPGNFGGYSGSKSDASAQSQSFNENGFGNFHKGGLSGSASSANSQSQGFNDGGITGFGSAANAHSQSVSDGSGFGGSSSSASASSQSFSGVFGKGVFPGFGNFGGSASQANADSSSESD